jgi:hypothetical protein
MRSPSVRSSLTVSITELNEVVVVAALPPPYGLMNDKGVTEEGSLGRLMPERIFDVKGPLEVRVEPNSTPLRGEGSAVNDEDVAPLLVSGKFIAAASFLMELCILEGENLSSSSMFV